MAARFSGARQRDLTVLSCRLGISGAGVAFGEPVGVDIEEILLLGKCGSDDLIGVLSVSSSTVVGGVEDTDSFRAAMDSVRPRDELDGLKELGLFSFDKPVSVTMSFRPPLVLLLRLLGWFGGKRAIFQ